MNGIQMSEDVRLGNIVRSQGTEAYESISCSHFILKVFS